MATIGGTTTILTTEVVTTTRTLTWTVYSTGSLFQPAASILPLHPTHVGDGNHQSIHPSLYSYSPSLPLAIFFTFLYFITTIYHGYLSIYLPIRPETINKHRPTIFLFLGSLLSFSGYLIRCISIQRPHDSELSFYATSTALIIVSPIFLCATLYVLLTRLIKRCLTSPVVESPTTLQARRPNPQKFLFLPPKFLAIIFLTSDMISFLIQLLGVAVTSSQINKQLSLPRGTHILLPGLALQLATFLIFLLILHLFCRRVRDSPSHGFNPLIMKVVVGVWIASGFILLRTIYRLCEFADGSRGYAYTHEWCLYVFEAMPVWCALVVMGWWHPVKWMQGRGLTQAQDTVTIEMDKFGSVVVRKPVAGGSGRDKRAKPGHVRQRSHVAYS